MLLNDFLNVLGSNTAVEGSLGMDNNYGTECAKSEATGLNELNLLCKTERLYLLVKFCL